MRFLWAINKEFLTKEIYLQFYFQVDFFPLKSILTFSFEVQTPRYFDWFWLSPRHRNNNYSFKQKCPFACTSIMDWSLTWNCWNLNQDKTKIRYHPKKEKKTKKPYNPARSPQTFYKVFRQDYVRWSWCWSPC